MAWAHVQSLNGGETGTLSAALTASFGSNVTAGNRILLFTAHYNGAVALDISTPTSTPSLTWTQLLSGFIKDAAGNNNLYVDVFTAVVASTGSLQISASNTATTQAELGWTAGEFSGLDSSAGSGCLDVSAAGSYTYLGGATTSVSTGTTAATHADNQLALAVYGDWGATLTTTAPSGFSKVAGLSRDGATFAGQGVATKTSASGATEGGTWTYTSATVINEGLVLVFKLAPAGGSASASAPALERPRNWFLRNPRTRWMFSPARFPQIPALDIPAARPPDIYLNAVRRGSSNPR